MDREPRFSFEGLFASGAPEPAGAAPPRVKYDFAVAYPDLSTVPVEALADSLAEAMREEGRDMAVYPHPQGYPPLREFVSQKLYSDRSIRVSPDEIILGDGSSQPIHMLIEALIDPGDVVITEEFVYSGTLRTLARFHADVRGVPCDDEGMLPDSLDAAITKAIEAGRRPKMVYTIPTFQNPMGWTMSLERRKAMLEVAQRHGVPILEDDCYVSLRYEGEPVTSIHSLDEAGLVMYVASFSKSIAPGMRLGYVTAPDEVLERAKAIKSGGGVNQFSALAVHRYATRHLAEDLQNRNAVLREKRDAMLAALGESFGSAASWSRPEGGLFIWLEMAEGADLEAVHQTALDADVGYHSGTLYSPDGTSGKNFARLCFGYNTPQEIHEGIARLAGVLDGEGMLGM